MVLEFITVFLEQRAPVVLGRIGDGLLKGGFDCSSAIFRNRRNVNCST